MRDLEPLATTELHYPGVPAPFSFASTAETNQLEDITGRPPASEAQHRQLLIGRKRAPQRADR